MDRIALTARRSVALALCLVVAASSCAGDDDDGTLAPLPIEGGTAAPPATPTVSAAAGPSVTAPPVGATSAPSSDPAAAPTGDWDGARFDVGTIGSVATLGAYSSIELDRWSYTRPDGQTVDAGGLTAEVVVAWWRVNQFSNVRVQNRTFVLSPDVEVLTLDPAGRSSACAEPPPSRPPEPVWTPSGTSALGAIAPGDIAVLTYSDAGLVTRIRLTRGC